MSKYSKLISVLTILVVVGIGLSAAFLFTYQVAAAVQIPNPIKGLERGIEGIPGYVGRAINIVLRIVGVLALVIFIYGGFCWMLSGGNPEKIKRGKEALIWGVFGLAIIFFSYAIINFILNVITAGG
jgi:hypothetical protein